VTLPPPAAEEASTAPLPARDDAGTRWLDRPSVDADARAKAEQLFNEARALMRAGSTAEACIRFRQSMDVDPALGTLMNLGVCYEQTARQSEACEMFTQALEWARREQQSARESFLLERLKRLGC
jgi:Flp pilus assembly protein TadD